MWKNFKSILTQNKGIFAIGIGDVVGNGISAVFWFVLAALLGPEQYGEIHYFLAIAGIAQIFALIGTSHTMTVYTAKNVRIQPALMLISLSAGGIAALIIIINFMRFDIAFLVFAFMFIEISSGILLGRKNYSSYSKFLLIQKTLLFALGLGLFHLFGVNGIIYGIALSYVPYALIIFQEFKKSKIDFSLIIPRKGFIVNNYATILSGSFGSQIDKFIIAPMLGYTLLGEYALAIQILAVLTVVSGIIFKYILPQDASGVVKKNVKRYAILLSIVIAIFGSLILPLIIPIFFPEYVQTVDAIKILSWTVVPGTLYLLYTSELLGLEKSKFVLISNVVSTLTIIIGFITLGPIFGMIGLSTVILFATCLQVIILLIGKRSLDDSLVKNKGLDI